MKNYRFGFDQNGYYVGLIRPEEKLGNLKQFPGNCTELEPQFKEGYVPRFDFKTQTWMLEKRELRQEVYQFEKYLKVYEQKIALLNREIRTQNLLIKDLILDFQQFKEESKNRGASIRGMLQVVRTAITHHGSLLRKGLEGSNAIKKDILFEIETVQNLVLKSQEKMDPWYKRFYLSLFKIFRNK